MSSKSSGSAKDSPKKKPYWETMVTRTQSAQSKRQLRKMDRSMKKITQLLKSPERSPKAPEKQSKYVVNTLKSKSIVKAYPASSKCASSSPENTRKTSPQASKISTTKTTSPSKSKKTEAKDLPKSGKALAEKIKLLHKKVEKKKVVSENKEFLPNKMKRDTKTAKITLKPKQELTTILSLNKRKRTTPQREITSPIPCKRPKNIDENNFEPEPKRLKVQREVKATVDELILTEDTDLTDEDLMEILTCPSPVWWEDPPDATYYEDPVFKSPLDNWKRRRERSADTTETKQDNKIITELKDRVASKIGKEEKITEVAKKSPIKSEDKFFNKRSTLESLLSNLKTKKEISSKNENVKVPKNISPLRKVRKPPKPNKAGQNTSSPKSNETDSSTKSKSHTISESSDLSDIRDDEILKDLENLDIPMEKSGKNTISRAANMPAEVIVLDDDPPEISSENQCEPSTSKSCGGAAIDTQVNPASLIEDNLEVSMVEGSNAIILPRPRKVNQKVKLRTGKVHVLSQKTLIWSSKIGDEKTINLVNDAVVKLRKESVVDPIEHQIDVPKDLPPLKKFSKVSDTKITSVCISKNDSCDSDDVTDSSSIVSNPEIDTISDTNVKFIMDDEIVDEKQEKVNESAITIEDGSDQRKNPDEAKLKLKQDGSSDMNNKSDNKKQFFLRNSIQNYKTEEKKLKTTTSDTHNDIAISTKSTKNKKINDTEMNVSNVQNSEQDRILVYKITKIPADGTHNVKITDISSCDKNVDGIENCKSVDDIISANDKTEKQTKISDPQVTNLNFLSGGTNGAIKKCKNHATELNSKKFSITKSEINRTYKAMTVKFFEKENMVKDLEAAKKPVLVIKRPSEKADRCENILGLCTCADCTENTVFGCPKFCT